MRLFLGTDGEYMGVILYRNGSFRSHALALLTIAALVTSACSGGEEGEAVEEPQARFGTADAELLVLAESDAPNDMTLMTEISGPQTLYQFAGDPERVETLRGFGTDGGYLQQFTVEYSDVGSFSPSKVADATTLYSEVLIFDDNEGAAEALTYLNETPNPTLEDVEYEDVAEFGDGAFLQTSSSGDFGNAGYYWLVDNALVSLIAQRQGGKPDADELLEVAQELSEIVAAADATGEELDLPTAPVPGEVIFEDDFEAKGDWTLVMEGDPPGSNLSRYVDGALQVGIDGPGGRWHDTTELDDGSLKQIGDVVVEVDAELQEGDTARWGLMCDVVSEGGFYLFVIGADGFAGIFSATSPNQPLDALAVVSESEALQDQIEQGQHHIRADCAGDPIARLGLYVNDEVVLEAYDDDPLPEGAVGMWIESQDTPSSALYDNLVISDASSD